MFFDKIPNLNENSFFTEHINEWLTNTLNNICEEKGN